MAVVLSTLDLLVSAVFTVVVAYRWYTRRRMHSLLWAWALFVWTVAVGAETSAARAGAWSPMTYRFYYAFGALMVAAWLGAGSLYLTAGRRLARSYIWTVAGLSLVGTALVLTYPINPAALGGTDSLGFVEVKVFPFIPVRIFIVISNILGSAAFVGAAVYSVWLFLRRHDVPGLYVAGVGLIAIGGVIAAGAHSIGVLGGPGLFRVSELAAIILIFVGYLLSSRRHPQTAAAATTPSGSES